MDKPKPQLTDEQRQELKTLVKAQVHHMLSRREELQTQATVQRQVWQALAASPTWSIVQNDKPDGVPAAMDEIWSMTPTVTKE